MTTEYLTSCAENTETKLSVHIITQSSSGTILMIRNRINGQKTEKSYIRLTRQTAFGPTDMSLLEMFLSTLLRMSQDTASRKELARALISIIRAGNLNTPQ